MKSSGGQHYVGLDHIRAFAAFTVFSWHFLHVNNGQVTPMEGVFTFPLNSLFAEGHTGVGIFMVLSGYLFAKITLGKQIRYLPFLYNRFLRLAPLLIAVFLIDFVIVLINYPDYAVGYLKRIAAGVVLPRWPHGGWSIVIEAQFYLIFPLIILAESKRKYSSLIVVAIALSTRLLIYLFMGGKALHDAAYWTIFGRIDQFIIGILFFRYGNFLAGRHAIGLGAAALWLLIWQQFDRMGGYYGNGLPSQWIVLTTLEGVFYGTIIAWYDKSFAFTSDGISGFIGRIGEWSYSIYLLHFFFVFKMANYINEHVMDLHNFYIAMIFDIICFSLICIMSFLSYTYFEKKFLTRRIVYVGNSAPVQPGTGSANAGYSACVGISRDVKLDQSK
jgi:peptidoglycan/LPS O-acetylase OafA/YrhL